ncbi:hypothetical protein HG537_0B06410 [Torulaspora globosa]|uniref:Fcf2 pre-rRNA processing C-terminal domain-containing protein n=1 Tax=Torulaspora globosa TaxID=48254 RepID=A0A7H9HPJ2_9SACH|nr:hypothetical protein HG537_0B06410 [Torulaspora sp. CBS 2947]
MTAEMTAETMEPSLDELFDQLAKAKPVEPANHTDAADPTASAAMLDLADPAEQHTQQEFEQIDQRLRSLPKLHNTFDTLASQQRPWPLLQQPKPKPTNDWSLLPKPDRATLDRAQRDLLLLRHRAALDPKRHYKKDRWQVPERFALGTIIEPTTEFHSSRLTNKQRHSTILQSLIADNETTRYFKRKYSQIQLTTTRRYRTKKFHHR